MSHFGKVTGCIGDRRRLRMKCDGTRAETRFRLPSKRTSPFKSAGASVQSTTGSRGVRISGSNAGCTTFRRGVKSTGYPFHSPVSPSLPLPCVAVRHHISTGLYQLITLSNGATARDGPRPPSRASSILPGLGQLLSNFYILALLHLPPLHLSNAA
jgi:hypothetical protein